MSIATAPSTPAFAELLGPIGLGEVASSSAALLERVDRKYIVPVETVERLAQQLRGTHRLLTIGGRSSFRYRTVYYDTPDLASFREHLQGRRRRFKCRSRVYADSGQHWLEVKLKGPRGRTDKRRLACDSPPPGVLSGPALGFLRASLADAYGCPAPILMRPSVSMAYRRTTFVAAQLGERLTCDVGLTFGDSGGLRDGFAIVESKSARGRATADRVLLALGARPVEDCSKYCLGVSLSLPGARDNRLRPLLRRYFTR
jgi:VTC domain